MRRWAEGTLKVLVSLRHSFAIRNFAPVIRLLAEQGHEIHLSFLSGDKAGSNTQAHALADKAPAVTFGRLAERKQNPWFHFRRRLRFMVDNLRYRLPMYRDASKLRERALRRLPSSHQKILRWKIFGRPWFNRLATGALLFIEKTIPTDEVILSEVENYGPDLIIVSPLVDFGSEQVDYIKAGSQLGIPTALVVNSWDNLTNKGLMRSIPDRVYVWNETQCQEAIEHHGILETSVEVGGAPIYDRWFGQKPRASAEEFKRRAQLDPERPYLLYICSSPFIAAREFEFVKRWITELRSSDDARLQNVGILVRPHPENRQPWMRLEGFSEGNVSVWPPVGANPVDNDSQADYFDSMYHSSGVVGINSSGLIEAGIVGRVVHTVLDPYFTATQAGTIHFHYLVNVGGGLLCSANSWDEHLTQLLESLDAEGKAEDANREFVEAFVRPLGLDKKAAPMMAESLVQLGTGQCRAPRSPSLLQRGLRKLLYPYAVYIQGESGKSAPIVKDRSDNQVAVLKTVENFTNADVERIILGPWVGDIRSEVLFWIPFLRWASESCGWDHNKLVTVSRGGAGEWYRDLAPRRVEALDYFGAEELARLDTDAVSSKKRRLQDRTGLDREILRVAKQEVGARRVKPLHPKVMYQLFSAAKAQPPDQETFRKFAIYRRFPEVPASGLLEELPQDYVAVYFPFNSSFPDTMENRRFVDSVIERLKILPAIVFLNTNFADEGDCAPVLEAGDGVYHIDHLMRVNRKLALQSEVIDGARAFIGSDVDLAYVAPFLGVESIFFHSEPLVAEALYLRFAESVLSETDGTNDLTAVQVSKAEGIDRVVSRLIARRT